MRAIAAYLVFFFHFNPFPTTLLGRLAAQGHIGVTIFFVLSGFLIPFRYADQVTLSRHWLTNYFRNRVARIYPLYALLTVITFSMMWGNPLMSPSWQHQDAASPWAMLLLNLTFLRGFFEQLKYTGIAQGWTLTVEECFYAFAPLLLVLLAKRRTKYPVLLAAAGGLPAVGYALVRLAPHPLGFFESSHFMFTYTFFGRAFEFMAGAALAFFVQQHPQVRRGAWATGIGAAWIVGSMCALSYLPAQQEADALNLAISSLWLPLGVALFFYGLITEKTWLRTLLATPVAQVLGKSSYAFYLVHLGVFELTIRQRIIDHTYVLFVIILGLALLLWKWVEEPLNQWLRAGR